MADLNQNLNDDSEEILIRDEDGVFKVWRNGKLEPVTGQGKAPSGVVSKPSASTAKVTSSNAGLPPKPMVKAIVKPNLSSSSIAAPAKSPSVAPTPQPMEVFDLQTDAKSVPPSPVKPGAKPDLDLDFNQLAEKIITMSAIGLKDKILLNRLKHIIFTQLKGVRKLVDTRLILVRPPQSGGMGFDGLKADKIVQLIADQQEKIEKIQSQGQSVSQQGANEFSRIKSGFSDNLSTIRAPSVVSAASPLPPAPVLTQPSQPSPKQTETTKPTAEPAKAGTPVSLPPVKSAGVPINRKQTVPTSQPAKTDKPAAPPPTKEISIPVKDLTPKYQPQPRPETDKFTDIKVPHKLIGPVQELRYPLVDFRRIADSTKRAIEKIEEKIANLGAEGFIKRVDGIKAWQSSEVFQLYLSMANDALSQKVTLDEVIKGRQGAKQPVLTVDEFKEINGLNLRLKF